jgi:membrane protein implicated in regulation of membrane protease activity
LLVAFVTVFVGGAAIGDGVLGRWLRLTLFAATAVACALFASLALVLTVFGRARETRRSYPVPASSNTLR